MDIKKFILELREQEDSSQIDLCTPQFVKNDFDYRNSLFEKYKSIKKIACKYNLGILNEEMDMIIEAIDNYYNGEIDRSLKLILETVEVLKNNKYICSPFNQSGAFTNFSCNKLISQVDLYKARIAKNIDIENKYSMFHIPFNMREIITTQRFSIPGVPCVYLGKTIYTSWMELDKPADSDFYVSRARVNDDISIFNLAVNFDHICEWANAKELEIDIDNERFLIDYTRVWLLSLASSYVVKQYNRNFKSEYIIPQLLMLSLKKMGIPAIAYYSKRISENEPNRNFAPLNVNVAIIMDANDIFKNELNHNIYSKLMDKIELSEPVNFSEYKNINWFRPSQIGKSDNIQAEGMYVSKYINVANEWFEYTHTDFAGLEKFIAGCNLNQKSLQGEVEISG
ncbi:MAG: hypothetical protein PHY47_19595 [Lachnospiraceae bacterium]|nr:hypothetical protein [Lachnospiraceae bacterium]